MTPVQRYIAPFALSLLAACGGGSNSSTTSSSPSGGAHNFSGGGSNVVTLTVGNGPSGATQSTFNIPYTSVTVCALGGNNCATITAVLVDTGSSGVRMMRSVLANAGVTLAPLADPSNPANTMHECLPFADGYAWGSLAEATVRIGGESVSSVPIEIIDDSSMPSPAVPQSCSSNGTALNSVTAFDANGVLGVGVFIPDCGSTCAVAPSNGIYYSCTSAGSCSTATLPVADQVANPVAGFATDNNGVILQLPAVAATGAATASGYLVFGIGTEANNGLLGATVITTNAEGDFNTEFNGGPLGGFIDSGSNALFFPDSSIPLCGQSGGAASFYCPTSTMSMSASMEGGNGSMTTVSFEIANINDISGSDYALDDAAGPSTSVTGVGKNYFDWGLPFFYGHTVFIALEGSMAGGTVGPYYAY